jgi:hypothetical protein
MSTPRPRGMTITPGPARTGSHMYYVNDNGKRYAVVHGTTIASDQITNCVTCMSFTCPHATLIRDTIAAIRNPAQEGLR